MAQLVLPSPVRWAEHLAWKGCTNCDLCDTRTNVSLFRFARLNSEVQQTALPYKSKFPKCDILGIGQAPGESEDITGQPFTGPAGNLLNDSFYKAYAIYQEQYSRSRTPLIGFTNIVACFPFDNVGKDRAPDKHEAEACRERLIEIVVSAQPAWIICFGNIAKKYFPGGFIRAVKNFPFLGGISHVLHPSSILRDQNPSSKESKLAIYRVDLAGILRDWADAAVKQESESRRKTKV